MKKCGQRLTKKRSYSEYNIPTLNQTDLVANFQLQEGVRLKVTTNSHTIEKSAPLRKIYYDPSTNTTKMNHYALESLRLESRALSPIYRSYNDYHDKSERKDYLISSSHLLSNQNSAIKINSPQFYDQFIDTRLIKSANPPKNATSKPTNPPDSPPHPQTPTP